jgi:hypothetical protein
MTVLGCEEETKENESLDGGKWGDFFYNGEYTFNGDIFTFGRSAAGRIKGTFTYTSTHITFTQTHANQKYSTELENTVWVESTSLPFFNGSDKWFPDYFQNPRPVSYRFADRNLYINDTRIGEKN